MIDTRRVVERVHLPAVAVHRFHNVVVGARAAAFHTDNDVTVERSPVADPSRCLMTGGFVTDHDNTSATVVVPHRQEAIDRGIFLAGHGAFNFYHWMVEHLAKLDYLDRLPDELRLRPLLVPEEVLHHPQFLEALRMRAGPVDVIVLDNHTAYRIADLVHLTCPNTLPFNLFPGDDLRVADCLMRPETVAAWRRDAGIPEGRAPQGGRRIFLVRDLGRRSYNQDEIAALFTARGFETVRLEELALADQISLMGEASHIAGPTGAAWTNQLFCRPGTRALCWMAQPSRAFSAYANLAHLAGVDLRYMLYPTSARSTGELYSSAYHLDPEAARRGLGMLLADPDRR